MAALDGLLASGRAADLILLVMAAEWAALGLAGRGWGQTLAALLPGALIVLALRAALTGAGAAWIALPLACSFPVHLLDLRLRGWLRRG